MSNRTCTISHSQSVWVCVAILTTLAPIMLNKLRSKNCSDNVHGTRSPEGLRLLSAFASAVESFDATFKAELNRCKDVRHACLLFTCRSAPAKRLRNEMAHQQVAEGRSESFCSESRRTKTTYFSKTAQMICGKRTTSPCWRKTVSNLLDEEVHFWAALLLLNPKYCVQWMQPVFNRIKKLSTESELSFHPSFKRPGRHSLLALSQLFNQL